MFALFTNVQEYVVFAGTISVPLVGVTVNAEPLQAVTVVFAMFGIGFTVTVTLKAAPAQEVTCDILTARTR